MKKCSLLLVEDDIDLLDILAKRFRRVGCLVTAVTDAQQAVELAQRIKLEVALVDRSLPGEDGLELMQRLHEIDPQMRVIILSGHNDRASIDYARSLGAFAYLVKPCPLARMETTIGDAFDSRHDDSEVLCNERENVL